MCSSQFACVSEGAREMREYNENESCQKDSEQEGGRELDKHKQENDNFFFFFSEKQKDLFDILSHVLLTV